MSKTFFERDGYATIVRKDSIIYRGQTDAFDIRGDVAILARNVVLPSRHTYFGLDPENTSTNYGITAALRVTHDIRLLNIDDIEAYMWLLEMMVESDNDAFDALLESFPLSSDQKHVMRDSDKSNDMKVLNFICAHTEYEGYIQPEMPKPSGGTMHSEMAVCNRSGSKVFQPIGQPALPVPEGRTYQGIMDEYRLRMQGQAMEQKRAAARRRQRSPSVSPAAPSTPTARPALVGPGSPRTPVAASSRYMMTPPRSYDFTSVDTRATTSPRTPAGKMITSLEPKMFTPKPSFLAKAEQTLKDEGYENIKDYAMILLDKVDDKAYKFGDFTYKSSGHPAQSFTLWATDEPSPSKNVFDGSWKMILEISDH